MQKIIDSLHEQYAEMPNLRAREIRVDKQQRKVFCALSYPDLSKLERQVQNGIIAYVKTLVPTGYTAIVTFSNDHFTENGFRRLLTELLKKRYPVFASISRKMEISVTDTTVGVVFHVNTTMNGNIETSQLTAKLKEYFNEFTSYVVTFDVVVDLDDVSVTELSEQKKLVQLAVNRELHKPSRYFALSNVVKHLGKKIVGAPMYISDLRKAYDSCIICGVVSQKTLKASKKDSSLYVCKFTLTDASNSSINCILFTRFEITDVNTIKESMGKTDSEAQTMSKTRMFANERKMKKMMDIYDGMEVVVRGRIAHNSFSEQLEMTVYDLSKCHIESIGNSLEYNKPVPSHYVLIEPEQYQEFLQTTFVLETKGKSFLSGKSLVVLHANVTGYEAVKDKLFAISGVKLVDGHLTSRIFTYINPEIDVDEKLLAQADTSVDRIVYFPSITDVIADIYKFTHGCDLVGMDIAQILAILNYYASPVGYKFTNNCLAQNDVFSYLFDDSTYSKKPNCSKLEDVARQCRVTCQNFRFCGDSALAAARCMLAIANREK